MNRVQAEAAEKDLIETVTDFCSNLMDTHPVLAMILGALVAVGVGMMVLFVLMDL